MQNLTQAQNHTQEPLSVQSHRVQTQNREEKEKRRVRHSDLETSKFNSHAVGMAAMRQYGFEIDFVRYPIYGSAARFFVIILKFIFTFIYEIKLLEKKFLYIKIIPFFKTD